MTAIILDDGSAALLAEVSALKAERNALLANIASQRMEIDGLKAEKDAALELANQSAARADRMEAERDGVVKALAHMTYIAIDAVAQQQVPDVREIVEQMKCQCCGERAAACTGSYEQDDAWAFACDVCCGHGNEDGVCRRVAE